MTDPITCPECGGQRGQQLGPLFLACLFCGGTGMVGGDNEPLSRCEKPPPPPPTATNHPIWADPATAKAFPCRLCLGSHQVTSIDEVAGTLVMVPCRCVES
ncbi:hypothetical protein ACWDA3_55600 [Nonomuraea rubra]